MMASAAIPARGPLQIVKATARDFSQDQCTLRAAALCYYTVFALPPLLILLIKLAGVIWSPDTVQHALETAFGAAGFRQESRALNPHVTLARIRAPIPIAAIVEKAGPYAFDREPFDVSCIVLFQSRLSRAGAAYEAVAMFPLGGPAHP